MAQASVNEKKLSKVMMRTEELMTLEPATRNSDKLLLVRYLSKYHDIHIEPILLNDVPSLETIRRSRQRIQAQGKCLPLEKVTEVRQENQVSFFNFFKKRK